MDKLPDTYHIDEVEYFTESIAQCIHVMGIDAGMSQVTHQLAASVLRPVFGHHWAC